MATKYVGIEISNSAVRVAEISVGGSRPELVHFGLVSLPPRAVVDGAVLDVAAVAVALERCLKDSGITASRVHLGVAGLRAITREIEMPNIPDAELDTAVRLQALDIIPFPADKTLLSARPLDAFNAPDGSTMRRVLIAAAHRDLVDPLLAAVHDAGLTPLSIDLTSSALVRSLAHPSTSPRGPEAIVSVGAGLTTVVIHESGVPHFVRTIASGGDAVTGAIAATLDIPVGDAEATKRNLDKPGPHIRVAAAAASDTTAALVGEIKNSIDYYSTLPGRSDVQQVVVTGGGSRLVGFMERLASQFRIPVIAGSCLSRIDTSGVTMTPDDVARFDPLAAVVIGLALPDPVPGAKPFNLLPPEIGIKAKQRKIELSVMAVGVAVIALLAALAVLKFLSVNHAENTANQLGLQVTADQRLASSYDKLAHEAQLARTEQSTVLPIISSEVYWPSVLTALSNATPSSLQVTSFTASSSVPAYIYSGVGPEKLVKPTDPSRLAQNNNAIGSLSLQVVGSGYPSFQQWYLAFENNAALSAPFLIESFTGISLDPTSKKITFGCQLAITGNLATPRYHSFVIPKTA